MNEEKSKIKPNLKDILAKINITIYDAEFADYGVTSPEDLLMFEEEDWANVGVKPFHRKKILKTIKQVIVPTTNILPPNTTAQALNSPMEHLGPRISNIFSENPNQKILNPIEGIFDSPPKPLKDAIQSLIPVIPHIKEYTERALHFASLKPSSVLSADQIAAIHLYTCEWNNKTESLYAKMNILLRQEDRQSLKPFFDYLKNLIHALVKLEQRPRVVWRGMSEKVKKGYDKGKKFFWWGFSSCTTDMTGLQDFLGNDEHTLFNVQCMTGVDIAEFSSFEKEAEVLLIPGTYLEVVNILEKDKYCIVELKEIAPPFQVVIGLDKFRTVWDYSDLKYKTALLGHNSMIIAMFLLKNGNVMTISKTGEIKIWNVETENCISTFNCKLKLYNATVNEKYLFTLGRNEIHCFLLSNLKVPEIILTHKKNDISFFQHLVCSEKYVVVGVCAEDYDCRVDFYDLKSGLVLHSVKSNREPQLVLSSDMSYLYICDQHSNLSKYNMQTLQCISTIEISGTVQSLTWYAGQLYLCETYDMHDGLCCSPNIKVYDQDLKLKHDMMTYKLSLSLSGEYSWDPCYVSAWEIVCGAGDQLITYTHLTQCNMLTNWSARTGEGFTHTFHSEENNIRIWNRSNPLQCISDIRFSKSKQVPVFQGYGSCMLVKENYVLLGGCSKDLRGLLTVWESK